MKTQDFNAYKTRYRNAIRQVLAESEKGRLDEAGFPAYSHRNPVINYLFWQRLHKVMDHVETLAPFENILDFGCGSGVMLPYLSGVSKHVSAFDVDLLPLQRVQKYIPLADNVKVFDATQTALGELPAHSFDLITALDVLEHVQDLPATINQIFALLKPNGQLVVSGPTENVLYQIGRKLAGPEYSGAYHERGIAEIKSDIARLANIKPIATLYWYLPLFEVFSVTRK
jgi:2-polyprenyl-3-methyl-5-hydroxy-6-metoxy-1,4-benzoquinol methylase